MPTQLSKLAITDGTTSLTFSIFQEGAEEASRQVISITPNVAVIENSREIITSKVYDLTLVGVYSSTSASQLQTWANASTDLDFSGYGLDGSILQGEGTIQAVSGFEDNLAIKLSSQREALGGYDSSTGKHSSGLSYDKNGLALYQWGDANGDNKANDWSNTNGSLWNFSSSTGWYFTTTGGAASVKRRLYFPFVGQRLYFNIDVTEYIDGEAGQANMYVEGFQINGTSSTGTSNVTDITGVQAFQDYFDVPANTVYVDFVVQIAQSDDIRFKEPTVQMDSTYTFTEFNT